MRYFFVFLSVFVIYSCKQKRPLEQFMLDRWQTSYIKITFPTNNGTDSTFVYEDDFSNSGGVKAQSEYYPDGTFMSWYLVNGKEHNKSQGHWSVKGDSLYLDYKSENRFINSVYHIQQTNYGFYALSLYDWDNDGMKDDTLIMKSKSF